MNTRDWSDLTRPRKQPLPSVAVRDERLSLELVVGYGAPAARLPQGAWQAPGAKGIGIATTQFENGRAQSALRYTTALQGADLSAVLYRGHAYAPRLRLEIESGRPSFAPLHDRLNAAVFGLARQIAPGTMFRAEWAFLRHRRTDSFNQAVVNIDREFSGLLRSHDSLHALLQWQSEHSVRPNAVERFVGYDSRRILNGQWVTRLQYKPNDSERWQFVVESSIDPRKRERFTRGLLKHRLNEKSEVELGWLSISGKAGTFWGQYANHDRLTADMRYSF
jgi:hypothetical protein